MTSAYVEQDKRFTFSGHEITLTYDPATMHPYSLAKSIYFRKAQRPDIFVTHFAQRTAWALDEAAKSRSFPHKLSKEERTRWRQELEKLKGIWLISGEYLVGKILKNGGKLKYEPNRYGDKNLETINRAVFNNRLSQVAFGYVSSEQVAQVIEDIDIVKRVNEDHSQFSLLEERCKSALSHFAFNPVAGTDREGQYQEALVVAWQCGKRYQGKNFARFNTFVAKALANKRIDMIRYFGAHCRRVHKISFPMGLGEEGSRLQEHLDETAFREWNQMRRDGEMQEAWPLPPKGVNDFEVKYAVEEGTTDEFSDDTYPLGIEKRIELISEGERLVREGENTLGYYRWLTDCSVRSIMNNPLFAPKRKRDMLSEHRTLYPEDVSRIMKDAGYEEEIVSEPIHTPF